MFTFLTMTFNHADFIIAHLNSIKFQIQNYAEEEVKLIICDDFSTDNTFNIILEWLLENDYLFDQYIIIRNPSNLGIVQSYINLVSLLDTEKFKLLAGDDLYYKNNIFELVNSIEKNEVIVSYPLVFLAKKILIAKTIDLQHITKKISFYNNIKLKKVFLKDRIYINAPTAIMNFDLLKDEKLIKHLSKYKWIEDIPLWHYLLNYQDVKFSYYDKPYILYRLSHGISHKKSKNDKYNEFSIELSIIKKEYNFTSVDRNKYLNLSNYTKKISISINRIWNVINIFKFLSNKKLKREANAYLQQIIKLGDKN